MIARVNIARISCVFTVVNVNLAFKLSTNKSVDFKLDCATSILTLRSPEVSFDEILHFTISMRIESIIKISEDNTGDKNSRISKFCVKTTARWRLNYKIKTFQQLIELQKIAIFRSLDTRRQFPRSWNEKPRNRVSQSDTSAENNSKISGIKLAECRVCENALWKIRLTSITGKTCIRSVDTQPTKHVQTEEIHANTH